MLIYTSKKLNKLHKEIHVQMHYIKNIERENLECSKRRTTHHIQGTPVRLATNFSSETMKARKQWNDIFKVLGEKENSVKNLIYSKNNFENECKIKTFQNKQRLR